jgi:hypothetical protein
MEAVMLLEVEIPSLRVLMDLELEEAEWAKMRYEQLNLISVKRIAAICHQQLYQKRMAKAYDKKVRPRVFQEGDLVLKKNQMTCHLVHRSDGLTSLTRKSCLSDYLFRAFNASSLHHIWQNIYHYDSLTFDHPWYGSFLLIDTTTAATLAHR